MTSFLAAAIQLTSTSDPEANWAAAEEQIELAVRRGAVGQGPGDGCGGPQHINHHGRIGPGGSASTLGSGRAPNRGDAFGGGEVGDQHGRDAGLGASQ